MKERERPSVNSVSYDDLYGYTTPRRERSKEREERMKERERTTLNSLSCDGLYEYTTPRTERGKERERARPPSPPSAKSRSTHMKSHATNKADSSRGFKQPRSQEWPPSDAVSCKTYAAHDTRVGQSREMLGRDQADATKPTSTTGALRQSRSGRENSSTGTKLTGMMGLAAFVVAVASRRELFRKSSGSRQNSISNEWVSYASESEPSSDW